MSAIQIKNVPPELHKQLRERARREGRNMSDYALDVLRRDLAMPTTREWLERLRRDEPVNVSSPQETVNLVNEGRSERDEQILRAVADRD
jgi:plasmid stability protein